MSISTAECIRHTAGALTSHMSVGQTPERMRDGCPHPGAKRVSSPRSREGVLTQEPRGCSHPGAERVSSPRSREGVLTQEPRGCPHPGAERVSSPGYQEGVLTPKCIGCPHPSPRAASSTYLTVSRTKVTWRHQTNKWWSSTSP